jgi:hypothetical protein
MPERIQRRRALGWRMPEGAVYVGRPTVWGNPFKFRTYAGLARVPAIDGSPWEYEGRISADGTSHPILHPDGHWTEHTVRYMSRSECTEMYRRALCEPTPQVHLWIRFGDPFLTGESAEIQRRGRQLTVDDVRKHLAGKDLACWCPRGEACHVDVLLEVANVKEVAA